MGKLLSFDCLDGGDAFPALSPHTLLVAVSELRGLCVRKPTPVALRPLWHRLRHGGAQRPTNCAVLGVSLLDNGFEHTRRL